MEAVRPSSRAGNQERSVNPNPHFIARPRTATSERGHRNGAPRASEENRSPSNLPRSFQGMLKTTTETGDIGLFSIKPSRIPQALNSPRSNSMSYVEGVQKPRHNFQPYGVPIVDDRRRLPSYSKDTTSEVIAMYQSSSPRPGHQAPQDSDHRSYSMTQASSYTLSNHRSFASLRSQQEGTALLQRPRSPFAYPTRLRRPGVRPSSPALTDGGMVDYSRRAEIERVHPGSGNNTSSPGSLYAQKRKPPGPYYQRSEANRSTPSLLSQQSPPRHSSNPNLRQSIGSQGDWPRRPILHSGNTSPARSARSYASTVNLYAAGAPASTTTTPGKLHPPSPLYYDYTEDFDMEDCNLPDPLPPPTFRMGHSIAENASTSIEVRSTTTMSESRIPVSSSRPPLRNSSLAASILKRSFESTTSSKGIEESNLSDSTPKEDARSSEEQVDVESAEFKRDTNVKRLSELDYSARELSTHVEEVFGLPSTPSREKRSPEEYEDVQESQISANEDSSILKSGYDDISMRSSLYSLNTNLQKFPRPPGSRGSSGLREMANTLLDSAAEIPDNRSVIARSRSSQSIASVQNLYDERRSEDIRPLPRRFSFGKKRPSLVESLDKAFDELDQLSILPLDRTSSTRNPPAGSYSIPPGSTTHPSGGAHERDSRQSVQAGLQYRYNGAQIEELVVQPQKGAQTYQKEEQVELVPAHKISHFGNVPNFSHQIPSQLMSRPDSPMIAPKPISPARQLRLRNSIPQIMKALPPLPPDPPIHAGLLVNRLPSFAPEHQLSPKHMGPSTPVREPQKTPQPPSPLGGEKFDRGKMSSQDRVLPISNTEDRKSTSDEVEHYAPSLPRLKLRTRGSSSRPLSPPDARPWNMEESYPWSSQSVTVELGSAEEPPIPALPKFKLKVTRASNSSQGTMIVNRESTESKHMGGAHVRSPKDLFTPTSGLDNIFRQVGKHLHTRASETMNRSETNSPILPVPVPKQSVVFQEDDIIKSESEDKPVITATIGAQSTFSDDSSHIEGRQKLRTRLSNLRARMQFHYPYRAAAQSSDNILWERSSEDPQTPRVLRSAPNLHSTRATYSGLPQRKVSDGVQKRKLRGKVRDWFRGAKTAIIGHKRSRSSQRSDDERAQLTPFD